MHMTYSPLSSSDSSSQPVSVPPVPAKPRSRMIGVAAIALVVALVPLYMFLWPEVEREQLVKTGVSAEGRIVSIEPTGTVYNNQPQVNLRIRVVPTDGEAFEAETKMIINPVYLPQFQPGMKVKVRYDAEDRSKIAVEETESGQR